ncbi:hypothetical protein HanPI659440_Chr16g0624201 [Helianthus annuus]|nr:hypothetical protein HanPI659440_Chr16g0624201 [Helianthus annuus]
MRDLQNRDNLIKEIHTIRNKNGSFIKIVITYITVMGRWDDIFKLFSIEDVDCDKVTLGMTVLASLRGGNFYNLVKI